MCDITAKFDLKEPFMLTLCTFTLGIGSRMTVNYIEDWGRWVAAVRLPPLSTMKDCH